jgi:uncharacterized protein YukE
MPEGFEYDPAAIRAFAEVFAQASAQVEQVKATLGDTSAKAADFGKSWGDHGHDFEKYMAALAEDLGNLGKHLGEVGTQLSQGTDLIVQADSTGLRNMQAIENGSGSGQ